MHRSACWLSPRREQGVGRTSFEKGVRDCFRSAAGGVGPRRDRSDPGLKVCGMARPRSAMAMKEGGVRGESMGESCEMGAC